MVLAQFSVCWCSSLVGKSAGLISSRSRVRAPVGAESFFLFFFFLFWPPQPQDQPRQFYFKSDNTDMQKSSERTNNLDLTRFFHGIFKNQRKFVTRVRPILEKSFVSVSYMEIRRTGWCCLAETAASMGISQHGVFTYRKRSQTIFLILV